ncbi:diguanylate cyclase [Catenuloplanes japonicus]|uniref:diguanylate cyclase n=1 Tax=Catenuloplanes japonicus TaxID=33876 RepID=UPI00054FF900|nr:diguanylate cyclase [Catenuloplanes japonicus]
MSVVYESDRTRIVRPPGEQGVLLKTSAHRRTAHERAILHRLAGVPRAQQLAATDGRHDGLALTGYDAPTLAESGPMDAGTLLRFATELAEVVAAVHARGVAHRDINPTNILAEGTPPRPILIDFDLATTFAEERPGFTHHTEIAGTLPYLAPEQTGRTGWPVDQRADLYALGATLYELAAGTPPFGAGGDPLDLIRSHLSAVPAPLRDVPPQFAAIVARLLEKEPGRRYQSAEGLLHDLRRMRAEPGVEFPPGAHDFPARLVPPTRLAGRDRELDVLRTTFRDAVAGRTRCLLVNGAPGVGKSSLIDQLRPMVTGAGGWFVAATFDHLRRGADVGPVRLAVADIARMLLAEPEAALAEARARLLDALGTEAGLLASIVPDFQTVLGIPPAAGDEGDPRTATARLARVGLKLLQVVARPDRPVVLVLDDLQWAGPAPLQLVDEVIEATDLAGLLLVGTYRDGELDEAHPLTALLRRWHSPVRISLSNLAGTDVEGLVGELLRLPARDGAGLAAAVHARTGGNPFDTVVLVNALRREGVLTPSPDGWHWDPDALRRHIGDGDVLGLLRTRIAALPPETADLVADLACLGGPLSGDVLRALGADDVLLPALEDGLLVADGDGVRFRHDRVRQAVSGERGARHLSLARRLAADPGCGGLAAEQYQLAAADVTDPAECRHAVGLLLAAAGHARMVSNFAATENLLAAAARLAPAEDTALRRSIQLERHAALIGLARLAEADEIYASIVAEATPPTLAQATTLQVWSLSIRGGAREAFALGTGVLAALGHPIPDGPALETSILDGVDLLATLTAAPENTDPHTAAAGSLIHQLLVTGFQVSDGVVPWLVAEAVRLRVHGGPARALCGPLGFVMLLTIPARNDYRTGYVAARELLAEAETLGWEPATSQARYLFALTSQLWFEPLEEVVRQVRRAREGLLRAGDQASASMTYGSTVPILLDCAATLDDVVTEIESGVALSARIGNSLTTDSMTCWSQLIAALRGDGTMDVDGFSTAAHLAKVRDVPIAVAQLLLAEAHRAAIFGDADALDRATAELDPMRVGLSTLTSLSGAFLRCLALVTHLDPATVAELHALRGWLADRAAEGPANVAHLHLFVEAECAAADGAFGTAIRFYDEALQLAGRRRPWHRALIAERAGRYHLAQGLRFAGERMIKDASRWYDSWGATGKSARLAEEFPFLRRSARAVSGSTLGITSETVDLLAVLRASQALSSSTRVGRLQAQVAEVLQALTGATGVLLVLRDVETGAWFLLNPSPAAPGAGRDAVAEVGPGPGHGSAAGAGFTAGSAAAAGPAVAAGAGAAPDVVPLAEAADRLPLTAFRYAERTGVPLLIGDSADDDRFRGDPYLHGVPGRSLLLVPILSRGEPRGMLVLESSHGRNAFAVTGIGTVQLIAGQLSVSLDNALLYASLERKVAERTEALRAANEQLETLAVTDPLTGLANRRRLTEVLEEAWRRAVRPRLPLALALVDIDHFKLLNDVYGHPAGDECLRQVSRTLLRAVRDTDTVARFGGEEFVAVLPGADLNTAIAIAERMRAAVAALAHPHELAEHAIVTVSVGVAAVTPDRTGLHETLIKMADEALYSAKREGRNRVVAHSP